MVSKATQIALAATVALAAIAPAHAQNAGGDLDSFRLPSSTPDIQGPSTPDNPIIQRPAPRQQTNPPPKIDIPAAPKPAAPKPATAPKPAAPAKPTGSAAPADRATATAKPVAPTSPRAPAAPAGSTAAPATAPVLAPSPAAEPAAPTPLPVAPPAAPNAPPASNLPVPLPSTPGVSTATQPSTSDDGTPFWQYLAGGLGLLALGAGGLVVWRRRRDQVEFETVMAIERPQVPTPAIPPQTPAVGEGATESPLAAVAAPEASAPEVSPPGHGDGPLRYALETTNLSITLMNATLSYQITVTNTSDQPLHNVAIFGDLASAHASVPVAEQLAGPGNTGAPLHRIATLAPGQSSFASGTLRLPLNAVRTVRADQAVMFIPLARMRIEAEGLDTAVVHTCVVGQKPRTAGAGLRPFRLDTGPRIYPDVGLRPLDQPTPQAA